MKQPTKKKRLNVTLDPVVFEVLRETSFRRRQPFNFLIENALKKYLSISAEALRDGTITN